VRLVSVQLRQSHHAHVSNTSSVVANNPIS